MVSWESGFESEYTENDDGTLTTNDGKTLNSKGIEIDSSGEVGDSDKSNTHDDDPYRKYDDGVINYNYDEMTSVTNGAYTYYTKIDTGVRHGMFLSPLDGVVDNEIAGIIYYFEGEIIREVEYFDYPLIESDRRYFDIWSDEFYYYFNDSEQVMEYYKREYIEDEWKLVEKIIYFENGTRSEWHTYSIQGRIIERYDQNGMVTSKLDIEYPRISIYSYFENGAISSVLEGTINTDNYTYENFVDHLFSDAPYHLYSEAVYEEYRSPGVLEESGEYGVMTLLKREYDEDGVLIYEREAEFISGNSVMWSVERTYVEGELYSESCWDADTYYYCSDD